MNTYKEELEVAIKTAQEAGQEIQRIREKGDLSVSHKSDDSPLTRADLLASKIIRKRLEDAFNYAYLGEETDGEYSNRENTEHVWVVDPLDGTKEFIRGADDYTVNIALLKNGEPVLGVIYQPATQETYHGVRGYGAYKTSGGEETKLGVSDVSDPSEAVALISVSHPNPSLLNFYEELGIEHFLKKGSSVKGCMVAAGEGDLYVRFHNLREWDVAAMAAIIQAAGGIFTTLQGEPHVFNTKDAVVDSFVAANTAMEEEVLRVAKEFFEEKTLK